jgi:putative tryptophan/tyrosine transport system substrate-binding protein
MRGTTLPSSICTGTFSVMGPPLRTACDAAGIGLVSSLIDPPSSEAAYRDAIAQASRGSAVAIMVADNPDTLQNRSLIVRLIGAAGIPAIVFASRVCR